LKSLNNQFVHLFLLIFVFLSGSTFEQEGAVKGVVKDKAGQPLKDVKITFVDVQRGNKFNLKSNREGKFLKFAMPAAQYKVTAELEGYKPFETGIEIIFGKDENLEIVLEKIPPKIDEDKDFQDGVNLFKQGQYKEASGYFEKVVAKFPDSAEAFYNLGLSYLRDGKSVEAIGALEQAIKLKRDLVEAYFALGECYFNKGESDKAIETFSRTLEFQEQNPKAHYNPGIVYYRFNKVDEAISSFEKAIELDPNFSSGYYQDGMANIKKGDFKKAIQLLEQFLRLEPNAPEAAQVKTMIEQLKKQIEKMPAGNTINIIFESGKKATIPFEKVAFKMEYIQ
jgi:tetratricopeptide (TPR) repeat protein